MYSWHCVDGDLPSGSTGRHTDTLTIHRATPHDEGMYYCTARKSGIRVNSGNASIEVDGKNLYKSLLYKSSNNCATLLSHFVFQEISLFSILWGWLPVRIAETFGHFLKYHRCCI